MIVVKRFILSAQKDKIREFIKGMEEVGKSPYRKEFRIKRGDTWLDIRISEKLWKKWNDLPSGIYLNVVVRIPEEGEDKPFKKIYQIDIYVPPLEGEQDPFLEEVGLPFLSTSKVLSIDTDKGKADVLIFV